MNKKLIILIGILSINTVVFAQFDVQGIIRPRFEIRNGYSTLRNDSTTPAAFVSQRTRLNFHYKKDKLETKFSLFDFRVWGNQVWKKDKPLFGMHEAWAKYYINDKFSVKFGRQELKYDNSRLISSVNWNQVGAAHDVIFLDYKNKGWDANFVAGWNQSNENKFGMNYELFTKYYKSLNIFFLEKKFKNISISNLNILDGNQDMNNAEKINFRLTSGLKLNLHKSKYQIIARLYTQQGKLMNNNKVNAFYTNLDFIYKFSNKLKINIGNEIKSGDNAVDSLNTTSKSFNILYGARHKLNGRIDYFNLPSTTKNAGLIDSYLKGTYIFANNTKLISEYHYFMLQNNYIYNNAIINKSLGHEFDFVLTKKISENIKLETGYSVILGTESLEVIKGGNKDLFNNWFYFMITVNPKLFSSKNSK